MDSFLNRLDSEVSRSNEKLCASPGVSGDMIIRGPPIINLGKVATLAESLGVGWTVDIDSTRAADGPTHLTAKETEEWRPPPRVVTVGVDAVSAIENWMLAESNQIEFKRSKVGSTIIVHFTGTGRFTSDSINYAMRIPEVVTIWATARDIKVWIAVKTTLSGGLYHLACTNQIKHVVPKSKNPRTMKRKRRPKRKLNRYHR